ncbi:MAG: hypothetical protein GY810_25560 [Aureispira sp.]|nr:hypothetical protein [Aureispira sp.]
MRKVFSSIAIWLAFCLVLMPFYGHIFVSPNQYAFGLGDGVKNYYTPAYHIQHDSSYLYLSGMNYPHSEHVVYTDGQFAVSNILQFINRHIISIGDYSVGILNWLMLLSLAFGGFLIYKILTQLKVSQGLAILGGIIIMLLSPQVLRLPAHYALAYAFHIPLTWWLILRPNILSKPIKWGGLLILNTLLWFLIHPYLGIMLVFFQISYWGISLLRDRANWKGYLYWILVAIAPFVLFKLFMQITDVHLGRISTPWGFLYFCGELDDIFVPNSGPLFIFLTKFLSIPVSQRPEALAYVGVFTTIAIATILGILIASKFKKQISIDNYLPNKQLQNSLLAGIPPLFLAMGFPFKQFPFLLDHFPLVNQLRSVGRFGWIFYYVATVSSIYFYHHTLQKHKSVGLKIAVGCILLFSLIEPIPKNYEMGTKLSQNPNLFNKNLVPKKYQKILDHIDGKPYQALLPIPYYFVGSESFDYKSNPNLMVSMCLAYHAKLPLLANHGSRASVVQAREGIQFMSPYNAPNPLLEQLIPDQPILIVRENSKAINPCEKLFLDNCYKTKVWKDFTLYEVLPNQLKANHNQFYIENFVQQKNQQKFHQQGDLYKTKANSFAYFDGFEASPSTITFEGKGAKTFDKLSTEGLLAGFKANTFKPNTKYKIQLWVHTAPYINNNSWCYLSCKTTDPNGDLQEIFYTSAQRNNCIYGDWSLLEYEFKIAKVGQAHQFFMVTRDRTPLPVRVDNLMISEVGQDVYRVHQNYSQDSIPLIFFKNNLKIASPNAPE